MKIRNVTIDDISLLTKMNIELRKDEKIDNIMTDEEVKERMIKRLKSTFKAYIFYDNSIDIGYALIDHGKTPIYLCQIFINKEYRNKGIGSKIIKELIKYINVKEIDVEVLVWNKEAHNFYLKNGFYPRYIGLRYKEK
jgi:GNAT superfamily N-acetyltransferase